MASHEEQFLRSLSIMVRCLPTPKVDERLQGLFHFFEKDDPELVRRTAEKIAREHDRFPTPASFASVLNGFKSRSGSKIYPCDKCQGAGLISTEKIEDRTSFTFKCNCANAACYPKVPNWKYHYHETHTQINAQDKPDYDDVMNHPEVYRKGLAELEKVGLKRHMPPRLLKKLEGILSPASDSEAPF